MNSSSNEFLFGSLMALFLLGLVMLRKRRKGSAAYDERQEAVRGRGYRNAYVITNVLILIYALGFNGGLDHIVSPSLILCAILLIGGLVLSGYCIFRDAYWGFNQKKKRSIFIFWIILILLYIPICLDKFRHPENLYEDGRISFDGGAPFLLIGFFVIFLGMMLLKAVIDRRTPDDEPDTDGGAH
ncbi:hypothetical protein [Eubacterium pyruvativorans]|uniref:hypothetical protein n=1 Tax=Eubacterium pyruvativorans TaxID=155865 RepID=UPI001565A5A2|nr:hypothetical protein [Eubacterium pyruvativorans]